MRGTVSGSGGGGKTPKETGIETTHGSEVGVG